MIDTERLYDVLVIGGGNAALCAAIRARESGASVLLLEHAPRSERGGNSRHTRNLRCMHTAPTKVLTEAYGAEEYWQDLVRVTDGETNERLARIVIRASDQVPRWMYEHGVRFQPSLSGTLNLARTNAFFLGGGKALLNAYYATAERLGVVIVYDAEVRVMPRVGLKDVGDGSWAFQVTEEQQNNTVPAYTYSNISKMNNIESVNIMKMDIEGAEAEVLEASADDIFSTTAISIIEVHDWIDGIKERVSKVIEKCKDKYSLDISHNSEFLILQNMDLLNK